MHQSLYVSNVLGGRTGVCLIEGRIPQFLVVAGARRGVAFSLRLYNMAAFIYVPQMGRSGSLVDSREFSLPFKFLLESECDTNDEAFLFCRGWIGLW